VFSHGQLYVALSQCTSGDHIKVILDPENTSRKTANIVYQEILNGLQMKCDFCWIQATNC
ncbi:hypothetical protein J132_07013, partial [Termitomyces sp. J132]